MKNTRFFMIAITLVMMLLLAGCSTKPVDIVIDSEPSTGEIYLYGEMHSVERILEEELRLWGDYYHRDHMRHLFIELPYYSGAFLNLWMQSENDEILEELYKDWEGTAGHSTQVKEFYKKIKTDYPETIFHGTDVGHQYDTTGQRFLKYLKENNLEDTEVYSLTLEAIEQGKYYYANSADAYRENKMVENFIREFDQLKDKDIMGIYGGAHTDFGAMEYRTKSVPSMAAQLKERYDDQIYSEDLGWIGKDIEPLSVDIITINGKDYNASYFGEQNLTGFKDYSYREFWRLEDAYDDFKNNKKINNVLPYDNYPMLIGEKQIFVIDHIKIDGSVQRSYYRSNGGTYMGQEATEEFKVK